MQNNISVCKYADTVSCGTRKSFSGWSPIGPSHKYVVTIGASEERLSHSRMSRLASSHLNNIRPHGIKKCATDMVPPCDRCTLGRLTTWAWRPNRWRLPWPRPADAYNSLGSSLLRAVNHSLRTPASVSGATLGDCLDMCLQTVANPYPLARLESEYRET